MTASARIRLWHRGLAAAGACLLVALCVGCAAWPAKGKLVKTGSAAVDGVGLTLVATSLHYVVVLNVVPPEVMYTPTEAARIHPIEGELILRGHMAPIGRDSRHTEAHVYSRQTGRPVTAVTPVITISDEVTGKTVRPEATLMQDVVVGPRDIHFGNNVAIPLNHEFSMRVRVGTEELDFSGRL